MSDRTIAVSPAFDAEGNLVWWYYTVLLNNELVAFNEGYPTEERAREEAETWKTSG